MLAKICYSKPCFGCSACCAIIFLVLGIFGGSWLSTAIQQQAVQQIVMTANNYEQWGQVPGSLGANVSRYYTWFYFTNPFEVVYFNATPVLYQMTPDLYQEFQNFTDPTFSSIQGGQLSLVKYNFWVYVLPNNLVPNQMVQTVNVGAMGYWYNAKNAPMYQVAANVIYALISTLEQEIVNAAISTGFYYHTLANYSIYYDTFIGIYQSEELLNATWFDVAYGMSNIMSMNTFVQAGLDGVDSGAARIIQDVFSLSYDQLIDLYGPEGTFTTLIRGIQDALASGYKCNGICTTKYLTAIQWSGQVVTNQPPNGFGIPPNPSITVLNTTLNGFPEIAYFVNSYMVEAYNLNATQFNITFPLDVAERLINLTPSPNSEYCKNEDTIIHQGNLQFMFEVGAIFDATGQTENLTLLEPIQQRFKLPSLEHAFALYKYVETTTMNFAQKQNIGGTPGYLVIANGVSAALVTNISTLSEYLLPTILGTLIMNNVTANNYDCESFITAAFNKTGYEYICDLEEFQTLDMDLMLYLVDVCYNNNTMRSAFMAAANLTGITIENFCNNPYPNAFASMYTFSNNLIYTYYNCSSYATSCGRLELALKQWGNGTITRDVIPLLRNNFPTSNSVSDWNSTLFPKAVEYYAVIQLLAENFGPSQLVGLDYVTSRNILNFIYIMNPFMIEEAFIYFKNNQFDLFSQTFFNVDPQALTTYLRWVMLELYMGGFSQVRDSNSLLWGYTDPLLEAISETSALAGGDPALNPQLSLAGANMSYEDALITPYVMYTGTNDSSLTRFYHKVYDYEYIVFNKTEFNGNETYAEFQNPWATEVQIYGTDSVINKPGISPGDTVPVFINSLFYQLNFSYSESIDYYGLEAYKFVLPATAFANKTNNQANAPFYADKWNGLINQTSILMVPLFFSKGHFLQVDEEIQQAVELYYDENLTQPCSPTIADDTFMQVEHFTGVNLGGAVRLQLNYEFAQDELFINPNYSMIPLYMLNRGTNLTQDQVNGALGQLVMGVSAMNTVPVVGYVVAALLTILCGFIFRGLKLKARAVNVVDASGINVFEETPTVRAEEGRSDSDGFRTPLFHELTTRT